MAENFKYGNDGSMLVAAVVAVCCLLCVKIILHIAGHVLLEIHEIK